MSDANRHLKPPRTRASRPMYWPVTGVVLFVLVMLGFLAWLQGGLHP